MKEDIPWKLLEGYFKGELSTEDNEQFHLWLLRLPENRVIFNQLKAYFIEHGSLPVDFKPNAAIALEIIHSKLPVTKKRKINFSGFLKVTAIALLCLATYWFISTRYDSSGKNLIIVATQDRVIKKYTLPDGSFVWINSHSIVKYNRDFITSRNIYLTGEAYFEVSHDKKHPFKVFANKSITTVVGTKFNLITKPDVVELSVTEGKVLFGAENTEPVAFEKGQHGVFDSESGIVTRNDNSDINFLAWKTRNFFFDNEKLANVMSKLSDVYHFQYNIEDEAMRSYLLTAKFHQCSLSEILQTLSMISDSKITNSGNIYVIKAR
jgi:transmembrane sensor